MAKKKQDSEVAVIKDPLKVELYRDVLTEIEHRNGIIDPHTVLAEAENPNNPLHDFFEWEDDEAARKFRLLQARVLIRTVKVVIDKKEVNEFVNITVQREGSAEPVRGYVNIRRVLSDEALKKQMLSVALKDLRFWEQKYQDLKELTGIVNDELADSLENEVLGIESEV